MQRWKLAIQSYDFWIEHIPGHENIVADGLSRFCERLTDSDSATLSFISLIADLEEEDKFMQRSIEASSKTILAVATSKRNALDQLCQQKED